jgi:glutamate/aspartate transport system permease protein
LATWDWQVFCKDTVSGDVAPRCFGSGGDITYLQWMLSAWGWTVSVAACALVVALVVGSLMGILRTTPSKLLVGIGTPGPSCSATSRCWCRSSSGTTCCRRWCRR